MYLLLIYTITKKAVMKINKYHGFSYGIVVFRANDNSGYIGEATLYYPAKKDTTIPVHLSWKSKSVFPTEEQAEMEINKCVIHYLDGKEEINLAIKTPSGYLR
jgi:hypothetical protein